MISAYEAAANALIGLVVSWCATFFVLGYSPAGSAAVTLMFFCLSFARAWAAPTGMPSARNGSATTSNVATRGTTRKNWLT